tara:strand:- start:8089 stop:8328 length:240 start_codon:yes stop_codon:yes gene_type:complete
MTKHSQKNTFELIQQLSHFQKTLNSIPVVSDEEIEFVERNPEIASVALKLAFRHLLLSSKKSAIQTKEFVIPLKKNFRT